jgi:ABC-2 type transport system permease protein
MNATGTMIGKTLGETRWFLGIAAIALFGLGWLSSFITCRVERQMHRAAARKDQTVAKNDKAAAKKDVARSENLARRFGSKPMDFSSRSFQFMLWNNPFVLLLFCTWAISRGSAAIAGEIERGTMDLTLSRPVSRLDYFTVQVLWGLTGLAVLGAALVLGNQIGGLFNRVSDPPSTLSLIKPAVNLALVGVAIYGYSLLLGSRDVVRWRPNLAATVLTLAGYVAGTISTFPTLSDWEWIGNFSVFKAFDPVEVATKGETFVRHAAALGTVGVVCALLAFVLFQRRDLPANS